MDEIEKRFQELLVNISEYNPNANLDQIREAWEFAKLAHGEGKRPAGELWTLHVLKVARLLADWKLDTATIMAGLLHDTIFAGAAKSEDLEKEFNPDVVMLIRGVTQIDNLKLGGGKKEEFVENLRKLILVIARDIRVILLRLADRLENLKTLWDLSEAERIDKAHETLEIYAPLAERLGIGRVKGELEDLAFPYAYPEDYKWVVKQSKPYFGRAEKSIEAMRRKLLKRLAEENLKAEVQGRKKHLYSLWKKLNRPEIGKDFSKIYDIIALRILAPNIPDCYAALGIVHRVYKPVPHLGISDFIAQPKPNGYQSIHTRVFGPHGEIVEVQIRTYGMHAHAEYGVAAHWSYSEAKAGGIPDEKLEKGVFAKKDKLSWMKGLVGWQKEMTDSGEFLKAIKFDALESRIFVFSPKGDVFDLPAGSTPVDFAFTVHADLGYQIEGAKVDGKIVPLNYRLSSGQVVEILKTKNPRPPSSDWLNFIVTRTARQEIKKYLRKTEKKA